MLCSTKPWRRPPASRLLDVPLPPHGLLCIVRAAPFSLDPSAHWFAPPLPLTLGLPPIWCTHIQIRLVYSSILWICSSILWVCNPLLLILVQFGRRRCSTWWWTWAYSRAAVDKGHLHDVASVERELSMLFFMLQFWCTPTAWRIS